MSDDSDSDTDTETDPNANWTPPWATQPDSSSGPSDMPAVPPEQAPTPDASITPQTGTDLANVLTGGPQQAAPGAPAAPGEIQMPDDYVGAPYAGSSGPPAAAPFAPPQPNLQAPPMQAPGGAPGLQGLGQPSPQTPVPMPAPVHDNRLAGLMPVEQQHALGLATDKTVDPTVRAAAWNALPANVRTETVLHAQGDQLDTLGGIYEHLSPQDQVAWQISNNNSEQTRTNAAIAKASTDYQSGIEKTHQWVQQQYQQIATRQAANDARAQQLANTKVGVQFSPLGKIGVVLGSMLGGATGTNGSNAFMDSLNKNIDRQVADQKYNLENQWKGVNESNNILGQEFARTGSMAEAEYTYKQAAYGATLNTIKTEAQQYVPGGTTHAKLEATYNAAVQRMAQEQAQYQQQQQEAVAKVAKARGDALESVAKGRIEAIKGGIKPEAFLDKSWLNPVGGGGAGGAAASSFVTAKQVKAKFPQLASALGSMPDDAQIPLAQPFTGSAKDYDQITKRLSEGAEAASKGVAATTAQRGTEVLDGRGQPLTEDGTLNGKPVTVADKADATKINEENANLQASIDAAREMSRILRSEPSTIDRGVWAKLKGLAGPFKAEVAGLLGAKFSSREEEAIEHISSLDFDSWKRSYGEVFKADQLDQFATGLSKLGEEKVKRIGGYRGDWQKVIYDPGKLAPAQKTPEQKTIAKGSENVFKQDQGQLTPEDQAWRENAGFVQRGAPLGPVYQKLPPIVQRGLRVGVPPSHLELFDQAYANALSSDPKLAAAGNAYIDEMAGGASKTDEQGAAVESAQGASTTAERDYAQQLLEQLIARNADATSAPETLGAATSTARDSNAPAKKASK